MTVTIEGLNQERLRSFDPLASVKMFRFDLANFGQILPETRQRVIDEQLSQLSEGANRAALTTFVLPREGDQLSFFNRGKWTPYDEIVDTGYAVAEMEAVADPRKDFLVSWAADNLNQYHDMLNLQPGERYVWKSEYPYEAEEKYGADFLQKDCGLQPERKMGFLYVATCQENGDIVMQSHTMDNSDSEAFTAALEKAEQEPEADISELIQSYDEVLQEKQGGHFHAGRRDQAYGEVVWQQLKANRGLIEYCLAELEELAELVLPEDLLEEKAKKHIYGVWAYFSKQLEQSARNPVSQWNQQFGQPSSREGYAFAVKEAFNEFATNGRVMAACGGSIEILQGEANILNASPSEVFKAIFGSVDIGRPDNYDDLGDRNFTCPKGHSNYRKEFNVPEKKCQVCETDVSCE